jgi:hypothetical protein
MRGELCKLCKSSVGSLFGLFCSVWLKVVSRSKPTMRADN